MEPDEQQTQEQQTENVENTQQQTENTEPTSEQTQQTEQPPERGNRLLDLYEQNLREAHQTSQRLQAELDRREQADRAAAAGAAPVVPDINPSEFWNKPLPHIAQIIRDETRKAVQPLYEFKEQIENESKYERLKTRFKNDVRYREVFPKIESIVDRMVLDSGADVNEALMNATILSAIGALHTGQLPGYNIDGSETRRERGDPTRGEQTRDREPVRETRVITPPHLRPNAAPQAMGGDNKPKLRDLTELEDRLRRENKQTKEEYLQWLDAPATEVAISSIGKAPKPDPNANPNSQVVRTNNPPAR